MSTTTEAAPTAAPPPKAPSSGDAALVDRLKDIADSKAYETATRRTAETLGRGLVAAAAGRPSGRSADVDTTAILALEREQSEGNPDTGLEVARDVLVFAPVALLWLHLHFAVPAYEKYASKIERANAAIAKANAEAAPTEILKPFLPTKSFLTAWAGGQAGSPTLGWVAIEVVVLVGLVGLLTYLIWHRRRADAAVVSATLADLGNTFLEASTRITALQAQRAASGDADPTSNIPRAAEDLAVAFKALTPTINTTNQTLAEASGKVTEATKEMKTAATTLTDDIKALKEAANSLSQRGSTEAEIESLQKALVELAEKTKTISDHEEQTVKAVAALGVELEKARQRDASRERVVVESMQRITEWLDTAERVATYFKSLESSLPAAGVIPPAADRKGSSGAS